MRTVEFQGYGYDFGLVLNWLLTNGYDEIYDFISEDLYSQYEYFTFKDVSTVAPTNTDSFTFLFLIMPIIPVQRGFSPEETIKCYKPIEANAQLITATTEMLRTYKTPEEYISIIADCLDQNISEYATFSDMLEESWSDVI